MNNDNIAIVIDSDLFMFAADFLRLHNYNCEADAMLRSLSMGRSESHKNRLYGQALMMLQYCQGRQFQYLATTGWTDIDQPSFGAGHDRYRLAPAVPSRLEGHVLAYREADYAGWAEALANNATYVISLQPLENATEAYDVIEVAQRAANALGEPDRLSYGFVSNGKWVCAEDLVD